MKDWKTYAIIGLAIWCYINSSCKDEECAATAQFDPAATVAVEQGPEEIVATEPAESAPAVAQQEGEVTVTEVTVVADAPKVSEEELLVGKEYEKYKQDKHLKYLKLVKASRASWVSGNHDHKGFDYKIFLEQYVDLKEYPKLLKSRLAVLRAEDPRLCEMVSDDLKK